MSNKDEISKLLKDYIDLKNKQDSILNKSALSHKKFIYNTILIVTILGAIVPFAAQFILPFFFPCANIKGVEIWNQYVSIILGVVATLMSVVSLKLSFDNVNQSFETELRTQKLLFDIELHLKDIEHNQDNYLSKTDIMSLLKNGYYVEKENDIDSRWNKPQSTNKNESQDI